MIISHGSSAKRCPKKKQPSNRGQSGDQRAIRTPPPTTEYDKMHLLADEKQPQRPGDGPLMSEALEDK
jgi:hypothetical protein